jgi:hypothetical protein
MEEAVGAPVYNVMLNPDEVGSSEQEDRKTKQDVVPALFCGQTIHHRGHQSLKHLTIVARVAASGGYLIPSVLTSQNSNAFRVDLQKHEIEIGKHLIMQGSQKVDMNRKIYGESVKGELCCPDSNSMFRELSWNRTMSKECSFLRQWREHDKQWTAGRIRKFNHRNEGYLQHDDEIKLYYQYPSTEIFFRIHLTNIHGMAFPPSIFVFS